MSGLLVEMAPPTLTIQDQGRVGWRRFGISTAGAMDLQSLAIANSLVGNPPFCAALETAFAGFRLRVDDEPVLVAAAGPGVDLAIGGKTIPRGRSAIAEPGDRIEVSAVRNGVYGYLAVAGGFRLNPEMGSLSTHRRSGIGPSPVAQGAFLPTRDMPPTARPLELAAHPDRQRGPIRIMAGPQDDWFSGEAMAQLIGAQWVVASRSDRMGIFLEGPDLKPRGDSVVSDGVTPGCVQVPPTGRPIVLMRDCQTTGGYPKIATVIAADLDRLSQCRPGEAIRFEMVDRVRAVAELASHGRSIRELRPIPARRAPETSRLLEKNLIDGVWFSHERSGDRIS